MQCFDRAIRLDGTVAGANGALGILWANFGIFLALPPTQARDRAREQALRALAIDPREPNALAALLTVAALYDWDLPRADALWAQLHAWYPSWVNPRQVMLYVHAARGESAAVRTLGAEIQRLDPRSVDPVSDVGFGLLLTGHAADAAQLLAAHAQLHPEASEVHRRLGLAWLEAGEPGLAVTHLERSVALSRRHAWGVANLACARARAGDAAGARTLLAELQERADGELVPGVVLAGVHASLGDHDRAFEALERAIAARDYWLLLVAVDPLLAPLRADPRFATIVARCTPVLGTAP
jgi:tetratricopeptide (TPR) repeat protein